ncbi:hypothetical protein [Flavobacterium sp.]|uniref:hypothetical protein n=1 Tax=Flavobacterium sp. TaxID=239 RepID=UPI003BC7608B
MGILELKNKIYQQIENSDEEILIHISKILEKNSADSVDSVSIIKQLLELSEKEYEEGKTETYLDILNESKSKYFNK